MSDHQMPETLEGAMQLQASYLIEAFSVPESPIEGDKLDFSKSSLMLVDQILRDFYLQETPLPEDLHFITSCYVFETLRQTLGGRYLRSDTPNDFVLMLGEPYCQITCLVMERVWACAQSWEANRFVLFYEAIEEALKFKQNIYIGATDSENVAEKQTQ